MRLRLAALILSAAAILTPASAQSELHGTVERIKVHSPHLEGNLLGDSPDRDVSVYLPPSYAANSNRRYPVVYMLHGYNGDDKGWFSNPNHYIVVPQTADNATKAGAAREMIVVMPNGHNLLAGSVYSNSVTTGDWEDFVAYDLVQYIDSHYRTLPYAASRGLTGHSMGGYGTLRIGMKHPEIFSSIYLLSPGPLAPNLPQTPDAIAKLEAIKTLDDFKAADEPLRGTVAAAAAWAPNPNKAPLYLDMPVKDGQIDPVIAAKYNANSPLAMIDQYIPNLRHLHAIGFDAGNQDLVISANLKILDAILTSYGIAHQYETYEGTHTSGIAVRVETRTLPFFSQNLAFAPPASASKARSAKRTASR